MASKAAAPTLGESLYRYGVGCSTAVFALAIVVGSELAAPWRRLTSSLRQPSSGPQFAPTPLPGPVNHARTLVMPASATTVRYSR